MTLIVAAFPGTGKSHLHRLFPDDSLDSDSSLFSWTTSSTGERIRSPDFPANYIQHIQDNIGIEKAAFIFVSTHREVLDALDAAQLPYHLVYPDRSLKGEYLARYRERGSPESFINLLDTKWDTFIDDLESRPQSPRVGVTVLSSGEFLGTGRGLEWAMNDLTRNIYTVPKRATLQLANPEPVSVIFALDGTPGEPVLTLTEKGFIYMGKTIEDAGEAHRLFLKILRTGLDKLEDREAERTVRETLMQSAGPSTIYVPCPACGEGVLHQDSPSLGRHPVQYHDCQKGAG